jgi:hypothetical protein
MMAVTVVCDEKSMVDKARVMGGTLSCRTKPGRTMSAVPQAPFGSRSGQAFSKSARRGAPPAITATFEVVLNLPQGLNISSKEPTLRKRKVSDGEQEFAFYYPGPVWNSGDWIKNLILFFDGVALLVPNYIKDKPDIVDPAIAAGLRQEGLLHILEPERIVDKAATQKLATGMSEIIGSGMLDSLAKEKTDFHELSFSRLGGYGDIDLANKILESLKKRELARNSEDGVSVPMHPMVRALVLVLLAQILRPYGETLKAELSPVTDRPQLVGALAELLSVAQAPSSGHVVASDLETVGVDLGPVPIDEVLTFRREHYSEHRAYARAVRKFVRELTQIPEKERAKALKDRLEEIRDIANDLKTVSRKAWKRPASFALSIAGAAWMLKTGDPIGALLAAGGVMLGRSDAPTKAETGAYSYIFSAASRYRY